MNRHIVIILLSLIIGIGVAFHSSAQIESKNLHWNRQRGYEPFKHIENDGLSIDNATSQPLIDACHVNNHPTDFTLRFVAANLHNHPSRSYQFIDSDGKKRKISNPEWGFFIRGERCDSLIITIKTIELPDPLSSESAVTVTCRHTADTNGVESVTLKEGIDCHTGNNIWQVSVNNGNLTISVGNHGLKKVFSRQTSTGYATEFGFIAYPGAKLKVNDISLSDETIMSDIEQTSWSNPDHLSNYLAASKDALEGYWTVFDRTLEESLLQLGGDYRFAIVKDSDIYKLIYLSGSRVNVEKWSPGMVKATLTPDPFPGIFNVRWFDSEGNPLSNSIKAQTETGDVLSIQFPYHSSTLRLRKIPQ